MERMGSNCEPSNMKWQMAPVRSKFDGSGGKLLPLPLPLPPGRCEHTPISIAENPLGIFEPPYPSRKHSAHQVRVKILKFLKLRKKYNSESTFSQDAFQPSLRTFRFQDQIRSSDSVEDVDMERCHYDSDQHSVRVNCDRHHRSFCSVTSDTSSSRSSASAQSFNSTTSRASVTPRTSFMLAGSNHQSGAQLMANILISIANLDEDDEFGIEYDHPSSLDGPHESAWHQPQDEMLAASIGAGRHSTAKQNSGRSTPRLAVDLHLTTPGLSRRFGKLDLSRKDKLR